MKEVAARLYLHACTAGDDVICQYNLLQGWYTTSALLDSSRNPLMRHSKEIDSKCCTIEIHCMTSFCLLQLCTLNPKPKAQ